MGPLDRVSLPTTTRPAPTYVPNACAKEQARPGVRKSPTTPRIPETPIFNRCSRRAMLCEAPYGIYERIEQLARRFPALLADYAQDRLGLANADVKPAVRPVDPQAIDHVGPSVGVLLAQFHQ